MQHILAFDNPDSTVRPTLSSRRLEPQLHKVGRQCDLTAIPQPCTLGRLRKHPNI